MQTLAELFESTYSLVQLEGRSRVRCRNEKCKLARSLLPSCVSKRSDTMSRTPAPGRPRSIRPEAAGFHLSMNDRFVIAAAPDPSRRAGKQSDIGTALQTLAKHATHASN